MTRILIRSIENRFFESLSPNKVIVLLGPRRIGKTFLLKKLVSKLEEPYLMLNGEDLDTRTKLEHRSKQNYLHLLGSKRVLLIDEAQKIPEVGKVLKLIVDEIEGIRIVVTGSSAFDINIYTGEPLTGRKKDFNLFALSESEFSQIENPIEKIGNLKQRLVYGSYPELVNIPDETDKREYLQNLVNSYLLKDILEFEFEFLLPQPLNH